MQATTPTDTAHTFKTNAVSTTEDKTVAILSYLTLIGFIVAVILHQQKKTKLGAFHLRQAIGFFVCAIAGWIVLSIGLFVLAFLSKGLAVVVGALLSFGFGVSALALFVVGLIAAIQGEKKPMPLVGTYFQKWLDNAFE